MTDKACRLIICLCLVLYVSPTPESDLRGSFRVALSALHSGQHEKYCRVNDSVTAFAMCTDVSQSRKGRPTPGQGLAKLFLFSETLSENKQAA